MTPTGLVSLDDAEALDPAIVGVKAASLAAARQRGLPVLAGVVVPVAVGRGAIELGATVLASEGRGRARLAVDRAPIAEELAAELRVAAADLGEVLIVRSSSAFDGDGRWSGAFNSVGDVRPDEVASAVRGCWSSLFSTDALDRFERSGRAPTEAGMAVLVQRQLDPACGGSAEVGPGGVVSVWATRGAPGPLLAGLAVGVRGTIGGERIDEALLGLAASDAWRQLADACRFAEAQLGFGRFEWAVEAGRPWILQLERAEPIPGAALGPTANQVGQVLMGIPASPGRAVGPAVHLGPDHIELAPDVRGAILVLDDPLPVFAPLLWHAVGLVALRGNAAAHLCQVARSLHVPAVVGLQSFDPDASVAVQIRDLFLIVNGDDGIVGVGGLGSTRP